ncbi:MAG: hypothetical protein QOE83_1993 [Actinomycetota bacterium]|jgi:energy-coupling factor transporter ATP-binding protein EcfA2|nr:hypothetical protein [Actinomycetota bacterium]
MNSSASLESVTLGGFQSYWDPQTVMFDSRVTLIAGKNDVGKSALLRGMRVVADPVQGAREDFRVVFQWLLSPDTAQAMWPDDVTPEHRRSFEGGLQIRGTYVSSGIGPRGVSAASLSEIELIESSSLATMATGQFQWESGPFSGTNLAINELVSVLNGLAGNIAYLAPRRIQPGPRGANAAALLTPTGENLTEVVLHLQTNEPLTGFSALRDFLADAFPQVAGVSVSMGEIGQNVGELHVIYRGAPDTLIPLSQCGTGVEQMLALGAGILTNREPRPFLIDEPQAYLHPHAERSLQSFLASHSEHQYIIATHSAFFLNAYSLAQTRMITMNNGRSVAALPASAGGVLEELGLTPADLWLAVGVLWVEGPSDVEIVGQVAQLEPVYQGMRVRAMPFPSHLASSSPKGAAKTYAFLREVVAAITPLTLPMLFMFDADEKTSDVRLTMEEASGGLARFLPVREIENYLLDAECIHALLERRCDEYDLPTPTLADVRAALGEELARHGDGDLYPRGLSTADSETGRVVGSELLNRLWRKFLNGEYQKVADGSNLATLALKQDPNRFAKIREWLAELAQTAAGS